MAGATESFAGSRGQKSFDRKIAVVGLGKSNQALCRYLLKRGASLTLFDSKTPRELGDTYREFQEYGVEWSLGPGYLDGLSSFRHIFLTPGMKKNQPEIEEAKGKGAFISTEIDLFLEVCKGKVAAVTGSAGKTTTASLAYAMLKESLSPHAEKKVLLGGNIGVPLIEQVESIPSDAIVVLELSSFQLQLCHQSPDISLLLNIRPNHLDVHKDLDEYIQAKKRIYLFQKPDDLCVLNLDDPGTKDLVYEAPGKVWCFTLDPSKVPKTQVPKNTISQFAWLQGDVIFVGPSQSAGREVIFRKEILIPGDHNVSNTLGAISLSLAAGASISGIRKAIGSFRGIEHRIEFVKEILGVRFYNDSIATSPDRTMALIDALKGPKVLILGGYDKGLPFDDLARKVLEDGCKVVTLGKTAPKIQEALLKAWRSMNEPDGKDNLSDGLGHEKSLSVPKPIMVNAGSLEEAVRVAKGLSLPGYSIVLSPACASFDMFPNFEKRGQKFKEIVERMASEIGTRKGSEDAGENRKSL